MLESVSDENDFSVGRVCCPEAAAETVAKVIIRVVMKRYTLEMERSCCCFTMVVSVHYLFFRLWVFVSKRVRDGSEFHKLPKMRSLCHFFRILVLLFIRCCHKEECHFTH